ncbi:MAG TPA: Eco57I restriction-modification methylase domain-containing protein [Smithellaceae bacterium]|nr:Eco57I restriction-modification methylase domain-containing protein [Smithellaceae bacterium]
MKNIQELKSIWKDNKEFYKKREIGSGVHSFIADILESEIFNLKKYASKKNGKNEFVQDANEGKTGRPDFILYINNDIIIPCEAKCYTRIQEGESQLLGYQLEWDKKYGILTDGYTWRFYNNSVYKELNIEQILNDPSIFKTFWNNYTRAENYYLSFFEKQGQQSLFDSEGILKVEDSRELFFEDITKLIDNFKNKLNIEGYFTETDKKQREKKATEISYAYFIQFILYKTLADNCYSNFDKEFKDRLEAIHKSLKAETYNGILNHISGISNFISQKLYKPFNEEQNYISEKLHEILNQPKNSLDDISLWLDIIVFIKKYNFTNLKNDIFGYVYENYLKELYEETNKGQYFTDPAVVNFMLDEIGFTKKEILRRYKNKPEKDSLSLIDPSCGSGTFLYSAVDRLIDALYDGTENKSKLIEELINNNIFGLDISTFPLYLAEMSILMRMLPLIINEQYNNPVDKKIKVFNTQDSIAEFADTKIDAKEKDLPLFRDIIKLGYDSFLRDEDDLKEMKESLVDAYRRRFDYVIGNPPYIGYNECCKQKILFTELIKTKKMSMGNIYGVNLNTVPNRIKPYAPKPNLYSFFIALGLGLLKDNGTICYIIPQTILTANDLDVLRYHLAKHTTIKKVITFAGKMFVGRGIKQKKPVATSSLIFILERRQPDDSNEVEVVNYQEYKALDFEKYLRSRSKDVRTILQRDLLDKIDNWNFLKQDKKSIELIESYKSNSLSIEEYRYSLNDYDELSFDKGLVFEKDKIKNTKSVLNSDNIYFLPKKIKDNFCLSLSDNIIEKKYIRLPSGSQGLKIFNKKYKIIWGYMNFDRFRYSDDHIMIDFNNVIISSDNKNEILFLMMLLNSSLNKFIFDFYLKNENEQALCIGIKTIKEFIRIPKIMKNNISIKEEIIRKTTEMFELEHTTLKDIVDFSKISLQKFDNIKFIGNNLVLLKGHDEIKFKIPEEKIKLVSSVISKIYFNKSLVLIKDVTLSDLKMLPIIDFEKQSKLKDYIDDLIFCMYFDIPFQNADIKYSNSIKKLCSKNVFYDHINQKEYY